MAADRQRRDEIVHSMAAFMRGEIDGAELGARLQREAAATRSEQDTLAKTASSSRCGLYIAPSTSSIKTTRKEWELCSRWIELLLSDVDWDDASHDMSRREVLKRHVFPAKLRALMMAVGVGLVIAFAMGATSTTAVWFVVGGVVSLLMLRHILLDPAEAHLPFLSTAEREEALRTIRRPMLSEYDPRVHDPGVGARMFRGTVFWVAIAFFSMVIMAFWPIAI